jgi:hypothetical protein
MNFRHGYSTLRAETNGIIVRPVFRPERFIPWGDMDSAEKRKQIAHDLAEALEADLLATSMRRQTNRNRQARNGFIPNSRSVSNSVPLGSIR